MGSELSPGGEVYILLSPGNSIHVSFDTLWNGLPFWRGPFERATPEGPSVSLVSLFVFFVFHVQEFLNLLEHSWNALKNVLGCFGRHHAII